METTVKVIRVYVRRSIKVSEEPLKYAHKGQQVYLPESQAKRYAKVGKVYLVESETRMSPLIETIYS